jgi:demethylphylloquinol methyltransferase
MSNIQGLQSGNMNSDQIRAIFDRIAPVYDQMNNWLSFGQHRIWKQMTVKWSEAQPGDICLDLCCGTGDLALMLAQEVGAGGWVFGVDFSPAQLEIARQRTDGSYRYLPITWVEGDALELPFSDETFDAATMGYGLRNVTDISRSLAELHRVLKPKAKAAILDLHRPESASSRGFQQWYLDTIVLPAAKQFGMTEEYAYLTPSLERFPTGKEQVKLAYEAGFGAAVHYTLAGGTMGVLVITK